MLEHGNVPRRMRLLEPSECAGIRTRVWEEALSFLRGRQPGMSDGDLALRYLWQESPEHLELKQRIFRSLHEEIGIPRILDRFCAGTGIDRADVFVANLFFLRFCFPGQTFNGTDPIRSRVSSPLHYDRYGFEQTSLWVPLVDTTPETGTFFWTDHPELKRWQAGHLAIAHPKDFHAASHGFEALLARHPDAVHEEFCEAGECLVFGQSLLHGSTQARSAPRITFDFRVVDSRTVRELQANGRLTAPPERIGARA